MIRLTLAGAAVWAAERVLKWAFGSDPYEPRHSVEEFGNVRVLRPTGSDGSSVAGVVADRRNLGNGMTIAELFGEERDFRS